MQNVVKRFGFFVAVALAFANPAAAQEKGKVGMTFGAPASVGILWHATETLAIRPEFGFAWNSSESGTFESESQTVTTGISALYYIGKWENLSTYLSPRYSYNRLSSESSTTLIVIPDSDRVSGNHLFSGSFGAQYWFGSRFSGFGEFGLSYGWSKVEIDSPFPNATGNELDSKSFSTRTAAGFVLYF